MEIIILLVSYVLAPAKSRNVLRFFYVVVVVFFFFPCTVSAVKIFWTAVAAHVEHRNVCLVVARHACSRCASLFCSVPVSAYVIGHRLSLPSSWRDIIYISN